ncbi:MAG: FecR domain-containing protein, partial [Pseudobdellovibrionaceae bacterium]
MSKENKMMIAMIFFGSLLGLLAVFEDQIFSNKIVDESEKSIGEISYQSRDVRYKNFQSYSWIDSQKTQQIYYNDAVFTGKKSAAQVQLTDGSQISIGENTLVSFKNYRSQKLIEMLNGNVRLSVNGSIRLKVGDEIQEITGRDIQLQVYSEKDQKTPMIKVLQGQATLRNREGKSVTLNKDEYRIVTRTPAGQENAPIPKPVQEIENIETPELPIVDSTTMQPLVEEAKASAEEPSQRPDILYYWKFEDLYKMQDQNITPLAMPTQLSMVNEFALPTEFENQDTYIQHDQNKYFSLPRDQFSPANRRSGNSFKLKSVNNGLNFVRFSKDGKNWSTPDQFYVNARFRFPAPEIQAATNYQLNPDQEVIQIPLNIVNEGPRTHYIIEYNVSPDDYTKMQSKLFYGNNIQLELKQVGNYRYRIRLIKNDKFLSKWTKFKELNVGLPDAPLSPQFLSGTKKGRLGETFQFQWKSLSPNQEIITEILDESKQVVLQEKKSDIQWTPEAAGKYTTRSFSVDRFGQKSSPSPEVDVAVLAPPPPKKRRPAATENAIVMKVEQPTDVKTNAHYGDSRVTTSGVLWTIQ